MLVRSKFELTMTLTDFGHENIPATQRLALSSFAKAPGTPPRHRTAQGGCASSCMTAGRCPPYGLDSVRVDVAIHLEHTRSLKGSTMRLVGC